MQAEMIININLLVEFQQNSFIILWIAIYFTFLNIINDDNASFEGAA